jgi:hypothetical protein
MKSKIIRFFDEIYMQDYLVIFASTHKEFCSIVKKEEHFCPHKSDDTATGEFHGLDGKKCSLALIWSTDTTYNLIHECIHACSWVLINRGIYLTAETEETYAYYYTYLIRIIKEILIKQKRRK